MKRTESNVVSNGMFSSEISSNANTAGNVAGVLMGAGLLTAAVGYCFKSFVGEGPRIALCGTVSDADVGRLTNRPAPSKEEVAAAAAAAAAVATAAAAAKA